ncbi:hypothetical protein VKT23_010764 [Stygiomarasmius scandens]|uniref:NAD(P)-binding protein n=1 Tax=Marasmiellus scandens TaxID=2682957 RepID=A0ABR1JDH7_9AGAR
MTRPSSTAWPLFLLLPVLYASHRIFLKTRKRDRRKKILQTKERVVILGSSSGIGRAIAKKYAKRGAYVCVVGRRDTKVSEAVEECRALAPGPDAALNKRIAGFVGDIAEVDAMVRLRDMLQEEWNGLDTLIVAAGVSAVRPLLNIAYSPSQSATSFGAATGDVSTDGITRVVSAASAALRGNYLGPLVAAATFIPLLSQTSVLPSIHLISSLASVIPAPTRSLYGSTKGASLILYQSLSIEHPNINWSYVLPSTVEGNFRAGAVDMFSHSESETSSASAVSVTPGLSPEMVADISIQAIDTQSSAPIFVPSFLRFAHWLYWFWPGFIEGRARKKYGFTA